MLIVSVGEAKFVGKDRSAIAAGPWTTDPLVENSERWHGQTELPFWNPVIVHV